MVLSYTHTLLPISYAVLAGSCQPCHAGVGCQSHPNAVHGALGQLPSCCQPQPSLLLSLTLFLRHCCPLGSMLCMFFSPKPKRGPSSPFPLTGWTRLQSGGQGSQPLCSLYSLAPCWQGAAGCQQPISTLASSQRLCPGSHSHSQRLPAVLTHVFFSLSACFVASDDNKMTVQEGNMEAHTCNSSNQEAEAGGLHILG